MLKMLLDVGPLLLEDAVHHCIADRAISTHQMMPNDSVLLRPKGFNCTLGSKIEVIRSKTHNFASNCIEPVG